MRPGGRGQRRRGRRVRSESSGDRTVEVDRGDKHGVIGGRGLAVGGEGIQMRDDGVSGVLEEVFDGFSLREASIEGGDFGPVAAFFGAMDDDGVLHEAMIAAASQTVARSGA